MQRRAFLKTTVLAAGGSWLAGCGSGGGVDDPFSGLDVEVDEGLYPQSLASGDPRETSVILWTRVQVEDAEPRTLTLQVALDEEFRDLVAIGDAGEVVARAANDHCVRVRLTQLEPGTTYYYRFGVIEEGRVRVSRTGRTRTAPALDADVPVRFAVASCQDFGGRYYHSHAHMAEQDDLAFVVHLGDYIYETLGDPQFQTMDAERTATFDDLEGAIQVGEGEGSFYAAASLDNYRQLYKLFRSDENLQRVHERFAMIAIWDDHEFANDCHGQTATDFSGRENEENATRRANADQAWFEYMPVDYEEPDFEYDRDAAEFPRDLTIYRDFHFGQHLHLVMTDLRRYRSDHLVPESAFPGAVAIEQDALREALGELPEWAEPYVNLDDGAYDAQRAYLNAEAEALGFLEGDFSGLVGVDFVNDQLQAATAADKPAPIEPTGAPLGMTFERCFKTERFSQVGSRYVLRTRALEALSKARWNADGGASEQAFGETQESWFFETLQRSDRTWKVWGNEFTFTPRPVDLSEQAAAGVIGLQDVLTLSGDDWDGMPSRRQRVLDAVGDVDNLVAVTGDIHAYFAGLARPDAGSENGLVEFVCGGMSSASFGELVRALAVSINPLAVRLAENLEALMLSSSTHLAYVDTNRSGYGLCEVDAEQMRVDFVSIAAERVRDKDLGESVEAAFETESFVVTAGDKRLKRPNGGDLEVWDEQQGEWS